MPVAITEARGQHWVTFCLSLPQIQALRTIIETHPRNVYPPVDGIDDLAAYVRNIEWHASRQYNELQAARRAEEGII